MRRATKRTGRLAVAIALFGLAACGEPPPPPVDRVVLVTIDTLRADRVGAYGDTDAHTPTLDLIASRGVRFEHAISPAPITLPSHTSMMTGLDPPDHGVRSNGLFALPDGVPTVAEQMKAAGFSTAAFVAAFVLENRFGLARGFDVYDDEIGNRRASDAAFAVPERRGDHVVDAALAWLADAPERFFLWVHLYDPHADYQPPPRFAALTEPDRYAGEIAFADHQVGRLIEGVRRRFGLEGLLLAVTSDHGEGLGEHGEPTHTYGIYDTTQRVPLLLMGPGLPLGRVVRPPVRLIDLGPTLLARAGAAPLEGARGRDLEPLWTNGEPEPRIAYAETLDTQLSMDWSPLLGLRTDRFKYIRAPSPELYDVVSDPHEVVDLSRDHPEVVQELDAHLSERLQDARFSWTGEEISDEDRARLIALGYLVSDSPSRENVGVVGGPNPREFMEDGTLLNRVGAKIGRGEYREGLAITERIRSRGERFYRFRGIAAALAGEPAVAREAAEALLARKGDDVEAYWIRAVAAMHDGHYDEARSDFEAALVIAPEHLSSHLSLGRLAELEGDFEAAEAHYRRAAENPKDPPEAHLHLAEMRLRQGRFEEADALFEHVGAEQLADMPGTSLRVAETEYQAGRRDRTLAILRAAHAKKTDLSAIPRRIASLLESEGQHEEALKLRRRLHADAPDDPSNQNDLAWSLALAGADLDEALDLAERAAVSLDGAPAVLDTLATVHLARGEPGEALAAADRGLAGAEGAPAGLVDRLHYVRATALEALGRREEARAALRRVSGASAEEAWRADASALASRLGVRL